MTQVSSILRCPVTHGRLDFIDPRDLSELRKNIAKGEVVHLDGSPVIDAFDSFLRTQDKRLHYPILDNILILLPGLAVVRKLDQKMLAGEETHSDTQAAMRFYDQIGWSELDDGSFRDADLFEDLRSVSRDYIHRCHLRINRHIPRSGKYMLDIASGPVQYPEYETYSSGFEKRICCDVSIRALRGAQRRLGEKGIYIQCDITNIPLNDQFVDAFVSLHTIYHVPSDKQLLAFRELARVTREGGSGVVVYSWGNHCKAMQLFMLSPVGNMRSMVSAIVPAKVVRWLKQKRVSPASGNSSIALKDPVLYFHPHDYDWYKKEIAIEGNWTLYVWRSVSVQFLRRYVHATCGWVVLNALLWLEDTIPATLGRFGQYPLMVFDKVGRVRTTPDLP